MSKKLHIMIIAGEISGDNHGSKLIKEFKKEEDVEITAIGGDKMAEFADRLEENIVKRAVVGVGEIVKHIPYFIKLKNRIVKKYFKNKNIDALVLIDCPGFNLRLAKIANKHNIPVFYYITPQVWAWGSGRIKILSKICLKLFCVFDFEKEIFTKSGGDAEFVGHPLLEDIPQDIPVKKLNKELNISSDEQIIALLPGSREDEVIKHLPVIAGAVKNIDLKVVIGRASSIEKNLYKKYIKNVLITEDIYALLKRAEFAVISSGTSTLEAAVIGTPFIPIYKISALSYFIAKQLVKVPFVSMVNILAGKEITHELIQKNLTVENLTAEIVKLKNSVELRQGIKKEMKKTAEKLGVPGASRKTAKSIMREIK